MVAKRGVKIFAMQQIVFLWTWLRISLNIIDFGFLLNRTTPFGGVSGCTILLTYLSGFTTALRSWPTSRVLQTTHSEAFEYLMKYPRKLPFHIIFDHRIDQIGESDWMTKQIVSITWGNGATEYRCVTLVSPIKNFWTKMVQNIYSNNFVTKTEVELLKIEGKTYKHAYTHVSSAMVNNLSNWRKVACQVVDLFWHVSLYNYLSRELY